MTKLSKQHLKDNRSHLTSAQKPQIKLKNRQNTNAVPLVQDLVETWDDKVLMVNTIMSQRKEEFMMQQQQEQTLNVVIDRK